MAKRHRMTPKRKAALRKAQLASARKRRRKPSIKRQVASKLGYTARNVAIGAAAVGGAATAFTVATNYQLSRSNKTFGTGKFVGQPTRQTGPHWMQFYGAGMSREKKIRGFKRHVRGYVRAHPHLKAQMHIRNMNMMSYGNPHGPMGPIKSERIGFAGQKALSAGRPRRRR